MKVKSKLNKKLVLKQKSKVGDSVKPKTDIITHKIVPGPMKAKQESVTTGTVVSKPKVTHIHAPVPVVGVVDATVQEPKHIDLFPWPFKRDHKGVVPREDWNRLVGRIQKAGAHDLEVENEQLHVQIQKILNERDEAVRRFREMETNTSDFCRNYLATYGG